MSTSYSFAYVNNYQCLPVFTSYSFAYANNYLCLPVFIYVNQLFMLAFVLSMFGVIQGVPNKLFFFQSTFIDF